MDGNTIRTLHNVVESMVRAGIPGTTIETVIGRVVETERDNAISESTHRFTRKAGFVAKELREFRERIQSVRKPARTDDRADERCAECNEFNCICV